jgi:hypothetical protein
MLKTSSVSNCKQAKKFALSSHHVQAFKLRQKLLAAPP